MVSATTVQGAERRCPTNSHKCANSCNPRVLLWFILLELRAL